MGANSPSPKNETRAGALARAYSSLKITCWRELERPAAVLLGPRHPDPPVGAQDPLPLEADVPAGLVGRPAARSERGELAGEVLGQPRAHLGAERRLLRGVAKVHGRVTLLDRPVRFLGRPT